jgi:hypothetical protein
VQNNLGLTAISSFIGSRSDGSEAAGAAGRRRLVRKSRKRDSDHGFDSGLAWEKESEEGNASTGLRRSADGWGRQATARHAGEASASNRAHGWMENRGEKGRRGSSPQGGAPVAACGSSGAARRWLQRRSKPSVNGGGG